MLKLFEKCPACGGEIIIQEIRCANCQLVMRGEFTPGPFAALSEDQFTFVRSFLRVRGNLSELEKVLGISYPTIRNKIDEINLALDQADSIGGVAQGQKETRLENAQSSTDSERQSILQQVAAGKLSASEAIQLLNQRKGGKE
ncbi:MAG TPA: DUF2089 domain-containing protein [Anaerolineaceae bacterium]|nr:DUF2089 domain-containing protein [Anaerolineaceae bacterium]